MTTAIEKRIVLLMNKQDNIEIKADTIAEMLKDHLFDHVVMGRQLNIEKINKWIVRIQQLAVQFTALDREIAKNES